MEHCQVDHKALMLFNIYMERIKIMKKILICAAALIFIVSNVFAADFTPPQLRFSAPGRVYYGFTGDALRIDVTVTGTEASGLFLIYTKDKAAQIKNVQNGYLGWHLMNQVDTCVYMSPLTNFTVGANTITWDGKENCGGKATGLGLLPSGEYNYYLWGFDNVHPKIKAVTTAIYPRYARPMQFLENDDAGLPDPTPTIYGHNGGSALMYKWTMGGDAENAALLETISISTSDAIGCAGFYHVFDPANSMIFYYGWMLLTDGYQGYSKFDWIPNGLAVKYPDWGSDINIKIDNNTVICSQAGLVTDGTYMYGAAWKGGAVKSNNFMVVDFDGQIVEEVNMSAENERRGVLAGSGVDLKAKYMQTRGDRIFVSNTYDIVTFLGGCYRGAVNYTKYAESGDIDDFYIWGNGNGDLVGDVNFETTAVVPWSCDGLPQMWGLGVDSNYFMQHTVSAQGTVSFYAYGPDGLGLGAFSYAGEILGAKHSNVILDNGSSYDGIYSDNITPLVTGESNQGARFCAQDSFKGIITNKSVSVDENAPVAFSVAQNMPNPFNPTTTISFTLPEAGMVSVDVYNVAGQKVDTIINEHMNTGSHSVVWDASGFSAGIYFYSVKSNNFTKTMKMTLVK